MKLTCIVSHQGRGGGGCLDLPVRRSWPENSLAASKWRSWLKPAKASDWAERQRSGAGKSFLFVPNSVLARSISSHSAHRAQTRSLAVTQGIASRGKEALSCLSNPQTFDPTPLCCCSSCHYILSSGSRNDIYTPINTERKGTVVTELLSSWCHCAGLQSIMVWYYVDDIGDIPPWTNRGQHINSKVWCASVLIRNMEVLTSIRRAWGGNYPFPTLTCGLKLWLKEWGHCSQNKSPPSGGWSGPLLPHAASKWNAPGLVYRPIFPAASKWRASYLQR